MMPEQPHQSEELLKRYAQERRAQGGDFALHPATRQLLQGEVKRVHGTAGRAGGRGWLAALFSMRGRLAFGSALVAAVVLIITFRIQQPETAPAEFNAPVAALSLPETDALASVDAKRNVEPLTVAEQVVTRESLARQDTAKLELFAEAKDGSAQWKGNAQELARADRILTQQADLYFAFNPALPTNAADDGAWFVRNSDFLALGRIATNGLVSNWDNSSTQAVTYFNDLALHDYSARGRPSVTLGLGGAAGSAETKVQTVNDSAVSGLGAGTDKSLGEKVTLLAAAKVEASTTPAGPTDGEMERRRSYVVSAPATTSPPPAPVSTFRSRSATDQRRGSLAQPAESDAPVAGRPAAPMLAAAPDASASRFMRSAALPIADAAGLSPTAEPFGTRLGGTAPPVLVNFSIEQSGSTVRVIDADGSIYEGAVETPPDAVTALDFDADGLKEKEVGKKEDALTRGTVDAQKPRTLRHREISFRAAGSNATLRQVVIINGRLSERESLGEVSGALFGSTGSAPPGPNPAPAAPASEPKRELLKSLQESRSPTAPRTNHFAGRYGLTTNPVATIEGTVRIGSTNQQWFRALRLK